MIPKTRNRRRGGQARIEAKVRAELPSQRHVLSWAGPIGSRQSVRSLVITDHGDLMTLLIIRSRMASKSLVDVSTDVMIANSLHPDPDMIGLFIDCAGPELRCHRSAVHHHRGSRQLNLLCRPTGRCENSSNRKNRLETAVATEVELVLNCHQRQFDPSIRDPIPGVVLPGSE
jgi:hypothetical protein